MALALRLLADQAFSRTAGAPLVDGNKVQLLCDAGENYPAWLRAIDAAEHWIHFESYAVHSDETGREFADALIRAAGRGVKVRLIYDWLGGVTATSWRFWSRLRRGGVDVRTFNRLRLDSPFAWMSRDHRKSITVDGRIGFVTGLCVGNAWVGGARYKGLDPWRDTGVAVEGPAVADIEQAFAEVWATIGTPLPPEECPGPPGPAGTMSLRVIATKPSTAGMFRLDQLVAALARERLWITDAYYVGASPYVQALVAAAQDGVDVRMLMPGASTDLPVIQQMTRAGYRPLLEAGVRIFEWNGSMVHAKTAVADGRWARVGSSNLNIQSWLGNWELDVAIEDAGFAHQMEKVFERDLTQATEVVLAPRHGRARVQTSEAAGTVAAGRRSHGRTRRAATAGALRMSRTFGAALTARRLLGAAEAVTLIWGAALLVILGAVALRWPKSVAYPLGFVLVWLGVSWILQALTLWRQPGPRSESGGRTASKRQDVA